MRVMMTYASAAFHVTSGCHLPGVHCCSEDQRMPYVATATGTVTVRTAACRIRLRLFRPRPFQPICLLTIKGGSSAVRAISFTKMCHDRSNLTDTCSGGQAQICCASLVTKNADHRQDRDSPFFHLFLPCHRSMRTVLCFSEKRTVGASACP